MIPQVAHRAFHVRLQQYQPLLVLICRVVYQYYDRETVKRES